MDIAASILIYGTDSILLQTRRWILEGQGYRVLIATQIWEFELVPREPPMELLILCHSLDEDKCSDAEKLALGRWPRIKSLALATAAVRSRIVLPGDSMMPLDGPQKFVLAVKNLVGEPAAALSSSPNISKGESHVAVSRYRALVQ